MGRHGDAQAARFHPPVVQQAAQPFNLLRPSRNDAERRAVDGRYRELTVEQGAHFVFGKRDAEHRAFRQLLKQAPPQCDQRQRFFQREDARQASGDVLAEAVTDHRLRGYPPTYPQAGQRVLDREEKGQGD